MSSTDTKVRASEIAAKVVERMKGDKELLDKIAEAVGRRLAKEGEEIDDLDEEEEIEEDLDEEVEDDLEEEVEDDQERR